MNQNINNFNQQPTEKNEAINLQNIEQSDNFNQQYSNQNNYNINSNNDKSKQNKIKIIIIAVVIVVALFIGIILIGGKSSSNNDDFSSNDESVIVDYDKTLNIKEINTHYDFSIDILSMEKNYPVESYFYSGDCFALKVNIKNNSAYDLSLLAYVNFALLNSSNEEIASLDIIFSSLIDGSIETEISSGKSESGYLYFFNIDDDGNTSNIDDSDISKLKISVPKELSKKDGVITGNYNYYYININK